MKIGVVSYSLTGNNEALAKSVAEALSAEHIIVSEPKPRAMGSIVVDLLFGRVPQVDPNPELLANYDFILFFGPIWIGSVATPLRAYFKYLKKDARRYAFATISGGADGPNTKLSKDLKKRVGREPLVLLDLLIADLLPKDPKPDRNATSAYKLNSEDNKRLTEIVVDAIRESGLVK